MSLEQDMEDEIRFHLEMRTLANLERGMSPEEARRDAERRFGDPEQVRRAGRRYLGGQGTGGWGPTPPGDVTAGEGWTQRAVAWLLSLRQDLALGIRMLVRHPLLTAAAVLSLALGIGANTANFSIVYGVLLRELPFDRAGGLVFVDAWNPERGDGDAPVTWADLDALRTSDAFEEVEAFTTRSFTLTGGDRPERIGGASVTPGLFRMLGVQPQPGGRLFAADEGAPAGFENAALISDGLWKARFGGDPDIVGRTIRVNGREIPVVGVMAPGFRFPEREDLWLPLGTDDPTDHEIRSLIGVARLREGTGLATAEQIAGRWSRDAAERFPESHLGWTMRAQPFRHGFVDAGARQFMTLLLASVGFVLLLACANVANLLLARASDRQQELAVRSSLGAGRLRLAQQVLVESLVLGLAGGALGILVARVWLDFFSGAIPEELAFWIQVAVDGPILLYTLGIALLTSVLFGLLPALQASRANLGSTIRQGSRSILGGRGRLRSALVVLEVGLAVVLLTSATLMVRSFLALQHADPGFRETGLLSFRIVQAGDHYDDPLARGEYYRAVAERLGALPGAAAATATSAIPADDGGSSVRILPEGASEDQALYGNAVVSTRGFFETLELELVAGRPFTADEELDPEADVVIVGRRLAQRLWPGEDPLGRTVHLLGTGIFRVVGVAPDLQYEEFGEELEGARLQLHFPYGTGGYRGMSVLVRAVDDEPGRLVGAVREELARIDPTLAPYDILTMRERRALTTWEQELFGKSFAIFGAIALVLALCGIYGVIAYSVARRTREIGIRIALGARPGDVRTRVVGNALTLAVIGAGGGLVAGLAFARALQGIVFGVSTVDPWVYGGAVAAMLATAALAGWLPARRASRVDPTEALRAE